MAHSSSFVFVLPELRGLPYSDRTPQEPDGRDEAERHNYCEARCGQVDDGGEDDFATPSERAAGRNVAVAWCRVPHAHGLFSFSVMVSLALRSTVLLPMALTLGPRHSPVHPTEVRRPPHSGVLVHDAVTPSPQNID